MRGSFCRSCLVAAVAVGLSHPAAAHAQSVQVPDFDPARRQVQSGQSKQYSLDTSTGQVTAELVEWSKQAKAKLTDHEARLQALEGTGTKAGSAKPGPLTQAESQSIDDAFAQAAKAKAAGPVGSPSPCGCPGGCATAPGGVGTCGSYSCPANGGAPGDCPCQAAAKAAKARSTVGGPIVNPNWQPAAPQVVLTQAQWNALTGHVAAPGVAATAPFGQPGLYTTPATSVRTVGYPSTYRQVEVQYPAPTYTAVRQVMSGTTSGCASGACAAPSRRGLFGWR